jgi:hypothetical protein
MPPPMHMVTTAYFAPRRRPSIKMWPASRAPAFYGVAESVAGQADHLMAFGDQRTSIRKQRIEMACCRSRRKKNFHVSLSL